MPLFITGIILLLVDFPSRISGDVPYIYILLIIFATDIVQFDNILVNTMCLKFLTVGRPTLLYIFLCNLVHSICLLVNPAIFSSAVFKHWLLCSISGLEDILLFFISPEVDYPFIAVNIEIFILVWFIGDYVFLDQIGKWEYFKYGLIIIPKVTTVWYHCLSLVDFWSHIIRYIKHLVTSLYVL